MITKFKIFENKYVLIKHTKLGKKGIPTTIQEPAEIIPNNKNKIIAKTQRGHIFQIHPDDIIRNLTPEESEKYDTMLTADKYNL